MTYQINMEQPNINMKKNILAEINRVREVMGLREQLEIVPDAEGTKEDPIQHTPTVAEAEEGKYYQNTKNKTNLSISRRKVYRNSGIRR